LGDEDSLLEWRWRMGVSGFGGDQQQRLRVFLEFSDFRLWHFLDELPTVGRKTK
jgi:hypothetical protein